MSKNDLAQNSPSTHLEDIFYSIASNIRHDGTNNQPSMLPSQPCICLASQHPRQVSIKHLLDSEYYKDQIPKMRCCTESHCFDPCNTHSPRKPSHNKVVIKTSHELPTRLRKFPQQRGGGNLVNIQSLKPPT